MFEFIKRLFKKNKDDIPVLDEHGDAEDPFLAAIVNECFKSDKVIFGQRNNDGSFTMTTMDDEGEN